MSRAAVRSQATRPAPAVRAMRPSGASWLGDVPSEWSAKRLKYCVDLVNEKVDQPEGQSYIGLEHIESWTARRITVDGVADTDATANAFKSGDVLFGKLRPYLAKVLHVTEPGVCTAEALVLRPRCVLPQFLTYYLLNRDLISVVDGSTFGSKMPRADWGFIGDLLCVLPPLPEQRSIAGFLDRRTRQIDELVAKKRRLIELLKEKRMAMISHAVTKGLNPDAPMKASGIDWLGEVPRHWKMTPLGRKIELQRGVDITKDEQREDGNVPVVSSGGVASFHDRALAKGPGVLVGRKGTAGAVHYVAADYWPHDTTLWVRRFGGNSPRYVYFKLLSMELARFDTGSANPTVNRNQVHPVVVSWPPIHEQIAIAARLDIETSKLDGLVAKVETAITRLTEYRQALISAAVTGTIEVREGDAA